MKKTQSMIETCSCNVIHEEIVHQVMNHMLDIDVIENLASFFKVFGDPTRIRILHALSVSEMCVCDLSAALQMTQSAISHQLRVLKQAKLVKARKEGKVVYYSLDDDHVKHIFSEGLDHVQE